MNRRWKKKFWSWLSSLTILLLKIFYLQLNLNELFSTLSSRFRNFYLQTFHRQNSPEENMKSQHNYLRWGVSIELEAAVYYEIENNLILPKSLAFRFRLDFAFSPSTVCGGVSARITCSKWLIYFHSCFCSFWTQFHYYMRSTR